MSVRSRQTRLLERNRPDEMFPPYAISDEKLIYLDDGFLGAAFVAQPLYGADDTTVERLKGALSAEFPPGTILQFTMLVTPHIQACTEQYLAARSAALATGTLSPVLRELPRRRADFFSGGRSKPLIDSNGVPLCSALLVISLKLRVSGQLKNEDVTAVNDAALSLAEALSTVGLNLSRLGGAQYLAVLRRFFSVDGDTDTSYDESLLLRDQVLAPGGGIEVKSDLLVIDEQTYVKIMSVKQYPKRSSLAIMGYLIGEPGGLSNQITVPYALNAILHYPDQVTKISAVRAKHQSVNYQAYGPMLRFIPMLAAKKEGMDVLVNALDEGGIVVEFHLSIALFSQDPEQLQKSSGLIRAYYSTFRFEMADERYLLWPMFWNMLPLFPSAESLKNLKRLRTMAVKHAVHFLPLLGEWPGTGSGAACMYLSRRSRPFLVDFYDSPSNYNAVLFAESGAGKSFHVQQIVSDYLSMGAKVWLIDVGRSYLKLCKAVGGEFIEFSERSQCGLNPFSNVIDIDDELDVLKTILAKMAAPIDGLSDYGLAKMEEAIKSVWGRKGTYMSVSDVADYLLGMDDLRQRDLGTMLFPFTRAGSYGSWFDGDNTLNLQSSFVVLELEELKNKPVLQQVVLLMLIKQIQHEMFLSHRENALRKKLVVIDESWDIINDPGVSRFMETGYRRFRKHEGAALAVVHSIQDFYNSPSGKAIAANSAHFLIMQQKAESIIAAQTNRHLDLDEYTFEQMKTVHTIPGKYSETMFYTAAGVGIGRLVVDRFSQVLFSTKGRERTDILAAIGDGDDVISATGAYIAEHG